jgi:hypothetical protein
MILWFSPEDPQNVEMAGLFLIAPAEDAQDVDGTGARWAGHFWRKVRKYGLA